MDTVTSLFADNANTNFGRVEYKSKNNICQKLIEKLGRNIMGIGCGTCILLNSVQSLSECLPADTEVILFKMYEHFYIFTVSTETTYFVKIFLCTDFISTKPKILGDMLEIYDATIGQVRVKVCVLEVSPLIGNLSSYFSEKQ